MIIPGGWSPLGWLARVGLLSRTCFDADVRAMFAGYAAELAEECERLGPRWAHRYLPSQPSGGVKPRRR